MLVKDNNGADKSKDSDLNEVKTLDNIDFKRSLTLSSKSMIYHYCSPETFFIITQNKTLRFSDIYTMNDFSEMQWGLKVFDEAIKAVAPDIPPRFISKIVETVSSASKFMRPLISCFSLDGDVVSQWRAYGQDGQGYAIGFEYDELDVPAIALQLLYNYEQQIREVSEFVRELHRQELSNKVSNNKNFLPTLIRFAAEICGYKNGGFSEEAEVRFIHALYVQGDEGDRKFVSVGGHNATSQVDAYPIKFRNKGSVPVAFIDIPFPINEDKNPIKKIFLGPKNRADRQEIMLYLNTIGIEGVEVVKSATSYI